MSDWNIGSVADFVGTIFGWNNITFISGTPLNNIIQQEINYSNTFTGANLGSVIPAKYQPSIIDLVKSQIMFSIELNQGGVENVSLGELSVNQNNGGTELARELRINAEKRLRELGRFVRYSKVIGGV